MGVYINLDIILSKISKEEWEEVYKETLELIKAYPFADVKADYIDDIERIFLDRSEEKIEKDGDKEIRYWRTCGDLESKRTAEYFTIYNDLSKYSYSGGKDIDDILELYLDDDIDGVSSIFSAKTQGEKYHLYILAIACLIESRFKWRAVVYGDITKEQAEIAIEWANGILKKPIHLPVRTDYKKLVLRVKGLVGKEAVLDRFMCLKIGENEEELNKFIGENFPKEEVNKYYITELKEYYTSSGQLGAKKILINYLNMGYSLEELSNLYCHNEGGPKFDQVDFIKAIADTWLFIPLSEREGMNGLMKSPNNPTKVYHQFGLMFLNMEFLGRLNNKYIPLEEGLSILNNKFPKVQDIRRIIEDKNEEIIGVLKNMGNELNQIFESVKELHEEKVISDFDNIMYYSSEYKFSDEIEISIVRVKEFALDTVQNDERLAEMLKKFDRESYITYLIRMTEKANLLLSQEAWKWIEEVNDVAIYKILVGIASTSGSGNVRNIQIAVFENREFFDEYIMPINKKNEQEAESVNKNIRDEALADIESVVNKMKDIQNGLEFLREGKAKKEDVMKLFDELEEKIKEK